MRGHWPHGPAGWRRVHFRFRKRIKPSLELIRAGNQVHLVWRRWLKGMKIKALSLAAVLSAATLTRADEVVFTTLPPPVQTTVIRETHIRGPSAVTHVVRERNGIYAVTVNAKEGGPRVVYVNQAGAIVRAPATEGTVVTTKQIQSDSGRYQLLKKEHDKEVYLDRQTGQKVKVEHKDHKIKVERHD